MTLLNPQKSYAHWLEFELRASGGYRQEIILYQDDTVEIICDSHTMASGKRRFLLNGSYEKFSDDHGWIHIDTIRTATDAKFEQFSEIDLSDFDNSITLEYFRVCRSPYHQHSHDVLNIVGRWTEYFDYLVILQPFTVEVIEALTYMLTHADEYQPEELPNAKIVPVVAELLYDFDRQKFQRIEQP